MAEFLKLSSVCFGNVVLLLATNNFTGIVIKVNVFVVGVISKKIFKQSVIKKLMQKIIYPVAVFDSQCHKS
jgi:hypothetical protein